MLTDRVNRSLLALLGLVLTAAGVGVLVAGLGDLTPSVPTQPVLTADSRALLTRNALGAWIAITTVGVTAALTGLYWLRTQLHTDRLRRLDLEPDRGHGHTRLLTPTLATMVEDEAEAAAGVHDTHARLVQRRGHTELDFTARLNPRMDLHEARRHIESVAVANARTAVAPDPLPTRLHLTIARRGERVR